MIFLFNFYFPPFINLKVMKLKIYLFHEVIYNLIIYKIMYSKHSCTSYITLLYAFNVTNSHTHYSIQFISDTLNISDRFHILS